MPEFLEKNGKILNIQPRLQSVLQSYPLLESSRVGSMQYAGALVTQDLSPAKGSLRLLHLWAAWAHQALTLGNISLSQSQRKKVLEG